MSNKRIPLNTDKNYESVTYHLQKSGVILDTCILLLLLVGLYNVNQIAKHPKLSKYNSKHFDILLGIVNVSQKIYTTTYIAPEISNLILNRSYNNYQFEYMQNMIRYFSQERIDIQHENLQDILNNDLFTILGVTDASIIDVASEKNPVVITDDYPLYLNLHSQKIPTLITEELINFQTFLTK